MKPNDSNKKRPSYRNVPFTSNEHRKSLANKFYNNEEMKNMFKVSDRTLQRWRDTGILPYKKIGGRIYYLAIKVNELMGLDDEELG